MSDKFVYEVDSRKKIVLPKFGQVPFGVIRKSRKMDPEEQFYFMFEELLDEKGLAVLDSLTADQVADLMDSWQNEAGVGLGESEDSQS
jgi:hypothetical protein